MKPLHTNQLPASAFQFQRLPNSKELNSLTPTPYTYNYRPHCDDSPVSPGAVADTPEFRYDPVQTAAQEWHKTNEQYISPVYGIIGHIAHIIMTLSPIIFLMLAFAALSVDGQPPSDKGRVVLEAAKVGPSLFPIVFAAVVGRLMRTFALWKAERGSYLGTLEQLNGSQNFLAAVERAFHLQGLYGWGLPIIVLWALSPLGGQSSLRVLSVAQISTETRQTLAYFNTDNYTKSAFTGASALGYSWPSITAIFQACLLAPDSVTASSTDLWGNVKIPLIQSLPNYTDDARQDWIPVPDVGVVYSSLSGVMVGGLNESSMANFTIESTYFNLSCSQPQTFNTSDIPGTGQDVFQAVRQWTGPLTYHSNESRTLFGNPYEEGSSEHSWSSFMVDTNWNFSDPARINDTDINIIYLTQSSETSIITGYNCSLGYTHVESWVNCDGLECYVAAMRPSRQSHPAPGVTPWNVGFSTYYSVFLASFPWATGTQHVGVTSPADWYISGQNNPFDPSLSDYGRFNADYTNVTGLDVARRLGTLVSTLWQNSITTSSLVRGLAPPNSTESSSSLLPDSPPLEALATIRTVQPVYSASKIWLAFTIIISFILLFCGVAGITFKYLCAAPDILGYVSTLAKDNPFFHQPTGADNLSGLDRARLLKDVMVQIGNVRPEDGDGSAGYDGDGKGYIALRSVGLGEDRRKGRLKASRGIGVF